MAENMEVKSLVGLATKTGAPARSDATEDESRSGASPSSRSGGFDGFLKTFIGNDKKAQGNGKQASSRKSGSNASSENGVWTGPENKGKSGGGKSSKSAKAASRLSGREKRALRQALEKTMPAEVRSLDTFHSAIPSVSDPAALPNEAAGDMPVDPEIAAAAEEAAKIIWNILYPGSADTAAGDSWGVSGNGDALARLADAIGSGEGSLAGLGATLLDPEVVHNALETANASAEMNIDAVLAALEELLDGVPRAALGDALAKTAGEFGLPVGKAGDEAFLEIATALGMAITSEEGEAPAVDPNQLLAELGKGIAKQELALQNAAASEQAASESETLGDMLGSEAVAEGSEEAAETVLPPEAGETGTDGAPASDPNAAVKPAGQNTDAAGASGDVSQQTKVNAGEVADVDADSETVAEALDESGTVNTPERQKPVTGAAENSGMPKVETGIYGLLKQFLEEKSSENPLGIPIKMEDLDSPEAVEKFFEDFANWLSEKDIPKEIKDLLNDKTILTKVLASVLADMDKGDTSKVHSVEEYFIRMQKDLESSLQSSVGKDLKTEAKATKGTDVEAEVEGDADATRVESAERPGKQSAGPVAGETATNAGSQATGQAQSAAAPVQSSGGSQQPAPSTHANASSMLDRIENIERLGEALRMGNRNGIKSLTLQLSPADLGKVTVRVESRDGVVSAVLRVEKPEAAAQLASSLQQLRENLRVQGIELGELDIRQQNQGQMTGYGEQRQKKNHEPDAGTGNTSARVTPLEGVPETDGGAAENRSGTGGKGMLNLFA